MNTPFRPYSQIHKLFGVFYKGELESVEMSEREAEHTRMMLSQADSSARKLTIPTKNRVVSPVIVIEGSIATYLTFLAEQAVAKFQATYAEEDKKYLAAIADAKESKTSLPNNFWQRRQEAFNKLDAAKHFANALAVFQLTDQEAFTQNFLEGA